jgi:transposase-like protein
MTADIQNPAFCDDDKAREALEAIRWPDGPVCPHCGCCDPARIAAGQGKAHRPGLYYCSACNGQFTVTVGSVMERSKIPLSKWLFAMHLMGASKKGMSALQLQRMLGVTYKTAWFLCHRIREAMTPTARGPLGGQGGIVEADETYIDGKVKNKHVSEAHLHRYLTEWDFKWNTRNVKDGERAALIAKGIEGKRLTYRPTN